MKTLYLMVLIVAGSLSFLSCKKSSSPVTPPYSMNATITDSGSTNVSSFIADTIKATDTMYGSNRVLQISGGNFDSSFVLKQVFLAIGNYTSPGNYNISNDSVKSVTAYFEEVVPASTGPTLVYFSATSGVITISYISTIRVLGTFNVNSGTFNYSGSFNAHIH